ncbi:hypothetical protein D7W79_31255 [Corallococcus exercitus]|nr:hypothetical protein D7W79_31255 [Corallococcus exercitus]
MRNIYGQMLRGAAREDFTASEVRLGAKGLHVPEVRFGARAGCRCALADFAASEVRPGVETDHRCVLADSTASEVRLGAHAGRCALVDSAPPW